MPATRGNTEECDTLIGITGRQPAATGQFIKSDVKAGLNLGTAFETGELESAVEG